MARIWSQITSLWRQDDVIRDEIRVIAPHILNSKNCNFVFMQICLFSVATTFIVFAFRVFHRRPRGSQSGREKGGTKVFKYARKSPWVPTLTGPFPKFKRMLAPDWAQKNALYYCAQSANSFSWVLFVSSYTTAIVSITACLAHAPKKCTQSGNFQFDIKSPSDFKILSARKLKTLFQKYKLQLTTGIHTCIGHVLRKYLYLREFFKDTTTGWQPRKRRMQKLIHFFFQSLSWLFFVKCKGTLLELNFYQLYISKFMKRIGFCHCLFMSVTKLLIWLPRLPRILGPVHTSCFCRAEPN